MPTHREEFVDDLEFDPVDDVDVDVDELLAAVHEAHLYEPPRRARRDRAAWRRIEARRERQLLRRYLSDWDDESDDYDGN